MIGSTDVPTARSLALDDQFTPGKIRVIDKAAKGPRREKEAYTGSGQDRQRDVLGQAITSLGDLHLSLPDQMTMQDTAHDRLPPDRQPASNRQSAAKYG